MRFIVTLAALLLASSAFAAPNNGSTGGGSGSGNVRQAATDCTAETGGVTDEQCHELDANTMYVCETGPCDGSGWILYTTASGSGATTSTTGVTHPSSATDDFAVGGTTSAAPFFVDESTGEVTLNIPGAGVTTTPSATLGSSLTLKEASNNGANAFVLASPALMSADKTCTVDATGLVPQDCLVYPALGVVNSQATGADRESNISTNDGGDTFDANVDSAYINPDTGKAAVLAVCSPSTPCVIGVANREPTGSTNTFSDVSSWGGSNPYPGLQEASWSTISGADDVVLNAQLSTAVSSRHSLICGVDVASGHNYVGPGSSHVICGEEQYTSILSGQNNTIIGPLGSSGQKSFANVITGGTNNTVNLDTVTSGGSGGNTIDGGQNNTIEASSTGAVISATIVGGKGNSVTNTGSNTLSFPTIIGGQNNVVETITSSLALSSTVLGGNQGRGWLSRQWVYGTPGYDPTDVGAGALQRWTALSRARITDTGMNTLNDIFYLTDAGVYSFDIRMACHEQLNPTIGDTSAYEYWRASGFIHYQGSTDVPLLVVKGTAAGTVDIDADATTPVQEENWSYGSPNWNAEINVFADALRVRVAATDGTDIFCEAWWDVLQSRNDSDPAAWP